MTFAYEDIASKFENPVMIAKGGQKVVLSVTHEEYGSCILKIGHAKDFSSLNRVVREVAVLKNISSRFYPRQYEFEVYEDHRFLILQKSEPYRHYFKIMSRQIRFYSEMSIDERCRRIIRDCREAYGEFQKLEDRGLLFDTNSDGSLLPRWDTALNDFGREHGLI